MKRLATFAFAIAVLAASNAGAVEPVPGTDEAVEVAPRTYFNLRIGAASTSQSGRPEICVEGAPTDYLSLEACGTGSGILHDDPAPEVAHFRVPITPLRLTLEHSALAFRVAPGFAELQIDSDTPGFDFGESRDPNPVETAGPELTGSIQWVVPLAYQVEFVMNVDVGIAWFPYAPQLAVPMDRWQPYVGINAGLGF